MNQLTEALHNISGAQHQYEVFTGANTHTPYLADTRQKYQRKLLTRWMKFYRAAIYAMG